MNSQTQSIEEQLAAAKASSQALRAEIARVIVGQQEVVEQVLWALLAQGHVLLEGAPGLGKTLLVRTMAQSLALQFSRIQFTPDLMPSDVTGNDVLALDSAGGSTGRFELHRGPVFTQLLLADEINRATPKTQSALLEAMQERAVTIGGTNHRLPDHFMVLATQNPIEMEGTYALPEAQLDRFLLMVLVPAPELDDMLEILERTTGGAPRIATPVVDAKELARMQALCRDIAIGRPALELAAQLARCSAPDSDGAPELVKKAVQYGAGVRAAQAMVLTAKARALLDGRPNVGFEDVRAAAKPALRHRLILSFEAEAEGIGSDEVVDELLAHVSDHSAAVERALPR